MMSFQETADELMGEVFCLVSDDNDVAVGKRHNIS